MTESPKHCSNRVKLMTSNHSEYDGQSSIIIILINTSSTSLIPHKSELDQFSHQAIKPSLCLHPACACSILKTHLNSTEQDLISLLNKCCSAICMLDFVMQEILQYAFVNTLFLRDV